MNPYVQVLERAEASANAKRARQMSFWEHPNMIVDDETLYQSRGALLREAVRILRSVPPSSKPRQSVDLYGYVPRDVPLHVFMGILRETLNRFDAGTLTHRQAQALALMQEAEEQGETVTMYVARHLGINRHSAFELVQRVSAKIRTSAPKHDIMDVRQVVLKLKRVCCVPNCKVETPRGDKPFCMAHYHDYHSSMDSHVQRWIDESGKRIFYRAREILRQSA